MSYQRCPICDEYRWTDQRHVCPPAWEVYKADEPECQRTIHALNARHAAEKYAEKTDAENEAQILTDAIDNNEETEIVVVTENSEERFLVSAELVPRYDARRKED